MFQGTQKWMPGLRSSPLPPIGGVDVINKATSDPKGDSVIGSPIRGTIHANTLSASGKEDPDGVW